MRDKQWLWIPKTEKKNTIVWDGDGQQVCEGQQSQSDTNLGVSEAKGGIFLFGKISSSMFGLKQQFMMGNTSARWSAQVYRTMSLRTCVGVLVKVYQHVRHDGIPKEANSKVNCYTDC